MVMNPITRIASSFDDNKEDVALLHESRDAFFDGTTSNNHANPLNAFRTSFSTFLAIGLVFFNLVLLVMSTHLIFSDRASLEHLPRARTLDVHSLPQPNQYEGLLGDPYGTCSWFPLVFVVLSFIFA